MLIIISCSVVVFRDQEISQILLDHVASSQWGWKDYKQIKSLSRENWNNINESTLKTEGHVAFKKHPFQMVLNSMILYFPSDFTHLWLTRGHFSFLFKTSVVFSVLAGSDVSWKKCQNNPNLALEHVVTCKTESRMKISTMRLSALYFILFFAEFRTSRATFEPPILFLWCGLCCSFQLRFQLPGSYIMT